MSRAFKLANQILTENDLELDMITNAYKHANLQEKYISKTQSEIDENPEKNIFKNIPEGEGFSLISHEVQQHIIEKIGRSSGTTLKIYAIMIGNNCDWKLNIKNIAKRAGVNKDTARIHVNHLIDLGYVAKYQDRSKGKFGRVIYKIFTMPVGKNLNIKPNKPAPEQPVPENPAHNKNNENNNKYNNNNNSNNNLLSASPMPSPVVVVEENFNFEDEKPVDGNRQSAKIETVHAIESNSTPQPTEDENKSRAADRDSGPPPKHKITIVGENIPAELKEKLSLEDKQDIKETLFRWQSEYEVERMVEITIGAIKHSDTNLGGLLNNALKHNYIPKPKPKEKNKYDPPEHVYKPPPPLDPWYIEQARRIEQSYKDNTVPVKSEEQQENARFIQGMGTAARLRAKLNQPDIDPKYRGRGRVPMTEEEKQQRKIVELELEKRRIEKQGES